MNNNKEDKSMLGYILALILIVGLPSIIILAMRQAHVCEGSVLVAEDTRFTLQFFWTIFVFIGAIRMLVHNRKEKKRRDKNDLNDYFK